MRNGPEMRLTCTVTTLTPDVGVILQPVSGDTQDNISVTDITLFMPLTAGWRLGERIELRVAAIEGP